MRRKSRPSSRSSSPSARRTTDLSLIDRTDGAALVTRLRIAGCVFAEEEADVLLICARTPAELEQMVQHRVAGVPLEQIVGWAEFAGMRVAVDPGVFVPRRRTELLLRHAVALAPFRPVVVELCCGSAALSLALASTLHNIELYATDLDPAAVQCARRNLSRLPAVGGVLEGDLYEPLPASLVGRVDLLLANAPYVPTDAISLMPPEARLYESQLALDGGSDGLDVLRRIITEAAHWLSPNGQLLVETSRSQASAIVLAMERHGMAGRIVTSAELDATAVIGCLATGDDQDNYLEPGH